MSSKAARRLLPGELKFFVLLYLFLFYFEYLYLFIWLSEVLVATCGILFFFFLVAFPAAATAAELLQSCPTLCDPIDGSPPGSPVPGILRK